MRKITLTVQDCKSALDTLIILGTGQTQDGKHKKLTFNVLENKYSIWYNNDVVHGIGSLEGILEAYNDL